MDYRKLIHSLIFFYLEGGSMTSPPTTPNPALKDSLTQVNDLVPKTSDLDHIFESDSDNDENAVST